MIGRLRSKFIVIAMVSVGILFAVNLAAVSFSMSLSIQNETKKLLERVIEQDGKMDWKQQRPSAGSLPGSPEDRPGEMTRISNMKRTFAVRLDEENQVIEVIDNGTSSFTGEEIEEIAVKAASGGKTEGQVDRHQYMTAKTNYGTIVAFADCSHEFDSLDRLIKICLAVGGISVSGLFFVVFFLSKWAVRPVEESFRRQKQFIADASHELKTPLAVISANTAVLEGLHGSSKWTEYIQSDVGRMSRLIGNMLDLARMEQAQMRPQIQSFDLSRGALDVLMTFESLAFEEGKTYGYEVEPGLVFQGVEEEIRHLIQIFMENAMKYSERKGEVRGEVKRDKANHIRMVFYNTGRGLEKEQAKRIFERFYRAEQDHNRESGGFGLGLAIAKSIVENHGGKIEVKRDEKSWTSFQVIL